MCIRDRPVLTREWMRFWFEKFRKGDMRDMEHQRQIIDTFVNSVYVLSLIHIWEHASVLEAGGADDESELILPFAAADLPLFRQTEMCIRDRSSCAPRAFCAFMILSVSSMRVGIKRSAMLIICLLYTSKQHRPSIHGKTRRSA